jgi:hypothetical protein
VPTALRLAATACAVIWRTAAWTLESLVCVTHKLVLINQAGKSPTPSKTEKKNTENINQFTHASKFTLKLSRNGLQTVN